MTDDLETKARRFRALHRRDGAFIIPNAWDAGSARILSLSGFEAMATTSAGVCFSKGLPDYEDRLSRADMLTRYGEIAAAVDLPVSGDLEAGYGDSPEAVAETIRLSVAAGMVGGSIEDHCADPAGPLYDIERATDRIRAAREAADGSGIDYTLTARAECYLVGHADPFAESVRRLNRYREAGADCLYAPGVKDAETIAALVDAVEGPINVVMGLAGAALTAGELSALGVKRISVGGSLARATYAVIRDAAREMAEFGTFSFAEKAISDRDLTAIFAGFEDGAA